ncbi:tripartite tricarboxylate transporter substrate binding protein [Sediminicoccus sp. KRV36]|uniref:Bug family tripartite tricarboxylate transporter substrate binding protein n=1 Tax=Sediminicoccus sp. KRV36 TaxID=3133721 RepID=UPI0020100F5D|nr:tripartite tricarboxylate transporter substrate binding protein [Sediminicoccus rosea]UPY38948.1 tripartite tricarboxylate transporter substrate binding protein [Sediminicoccus rosea]
MTPACLTRRATLALLAAAAVARPGQAAPALDRPVRLVTGAGPGSGTDSVARLLAQHLSGDYAPQVLVENRTGAVTRLALEHVKAAAPDGATFMYLPMPVLSLFPHVYPRTTRYDPLADFAPVATVGTLPYGLMVRADHPAPDLAGLLDAMRARGNATCYAQLGTPQHMLALTLARQAGLALTVVPYSNGYAVALTDLLAGRIDMVFSHLADVAAPSRDGRGRLLAVTTPERLAAFPTIATFAQSGFAELTADEAVCIVLPARTPPVLVAALHAAVSRAVAAEPVRERLARLEITPGVLSPEATAARLRADFAAWGPVVAASGFTAEG